MKTITYDETTHRLVPVEPTPQHIDSIAMRYRHDFGLLPDKLQEDIRAFARQMFEECTGQGFFKIEAAPQPECVEQRPDKTVPAPEPVFAEHDSRPRWFSFLEKLRDLLREDDPLDLYDETCEVVNSVGLINHAGVAPASRAVTDVLTERHRQVKVEGWSEERDDTEHWDGALARAAATYAGCAYVDMGDEIPATWPWDGSWWKPSSPRRDLVKAGALILAEIERLDRGEAKVVNAQEPSNDSE